MEEFLTLTLSGLATAAIFAVAASGLVLTYATTGIFNFAHGAIGMVGAFAYWQLRFDWGLPAPVALVLTLVIGAPLFGVLLEVVLMRKLQSVPEVTKLVVTISLLIALLGAALWIWEPAVARPIDFFFQGDKVEILGVFLSYHQLIAFGLAVAIAAGLRFLLYSTTTGVAMRAAVDDRPLAMLNGARPDRVSMMAWAIGCSMAVLSGVLIAPSQGLRHELLTLAIVNTYAAALLARLRSLPVAFGGAVVLGLADAYATGYFPSSNRVLATMVAALPGLLLFVALLVLPQVRLRAARAGQHVERFPMPTWRGSLLGCLSIVAFTVVVAFAAVPRDAMILAELFGFAILALSLVPLVGWGGQISLCQMSFAAVGALAMGHLGGGGNPLALVYAAILGGAVGGLVALPALRLSGLYLALGTGAFAIVLDQWLFKLQSISLGPLEIRFFELGSLGIDRLDLPLLDLDDQRVNALVMAVAFCLLSLLVVGIRRSTFGSQLLALKDSPAACATIGMNPRGIKLAVFAVSGAIAAVGGALYATTLESVSPDRFAFFQSLPLLMLAIVGGVGSFGGAFFAGVFVRVIPLLGDVVPALANLQRVLPGLLGINLARNPNGVFPRVVRDFTPIVRAPRAIGSLLGFIGLLVLLRFGGVIDNWPFLFLAMGGTVLVPRLVLGPISDRTIDGEAVVEQIPPRGTADDGVPLEWVGLVRPFTAADDALLAREGASPEAVR